MPRFLESMRTLQHDEPKIGMIESEWPTTPEGVQALLKHMDEATSEDEETIEFNWDRRA